ncbi:MAG: hypothetical protein KDH91_08630, partial [Rhodoferax sp.]|nr:hypothetical protein [Rhodoferax sp.]
AEELFLVQAGTHSNTTAPVRLRDIAALPLVIPSRPNAIRMRVESELAALACSPRIALEIDGVSAILDLVAEGVGSAILSRNAVASSARPELFRLRPIREPQLHVQIALAVSAQRPATLTQQATQALIVDTLATMLPPREPGEPSAPAARGDAA